MYLIAFVYAISIWDAFDVRLSRGFVRSQLDDHVKDGK